MGSSVGGRDLEFGVATWKSYYGQKRGRDMKLMSRHRLVSKRSRHGTDVATWPVGKRSRDMKLMSRHRGVSRRVATWFWCRNLA